MVHVHKTTLKNLYYTISFTECSIDNEFIFFDILIHIHLNHCHYSSPLYRDCLHLLFFSTRQHFYRSAVVILHPRYVEHHGSNSDAIISISIARFKNENRGWKQKHDRETENQWVKRRSKKNEGVYVHRVRFHCCSSLP